MSGYIDATLYNELLADRNHLKQELINFTSWVESLRGQNAELLSALMLLVKDHDRDMQSSAETWDYARNTLALVKKEFAA